MYRNSIAFSCALVCAFTTTSVQAQKGQNAISALVESALNRNREIQATRQRVAEAQGLLRQAGVRPNPTLEIEGGTGRPLKTKGEEEYSAGYFHPIELGGKRGKRISVAEISVSLAEAELDERARQLAYDVKSHAIDALTDREKSRALDRLASANQQAYKLVEARAKEGDAPKLDAQLLLVEQNRTEAQRSSLAGRLEADFVEIRRLVGLDSGTVVTIGDSLPTATRGFTLAELQQTALNKRPDARVANLIANQGEAEVTLARAQSWPDVTVSARYIRRYSAFDQLGLNSAGVASPLRDEDDVLMFGLSIPLFTGKKNQGNIQAANARATGNALRRQHLEQSIPLEVEAAFRRLTAAKNALAVYDRGIVAQSEQNLQVIREAYQLGQLRLLDVLNEQRRLSDTELAYIDAKAEFAKALIELERAVGGDLI